MTDFSLLWLQALRHLSIAGFGAQLIGLFKNGMVQSFIIARTLSPEGLILFTRAKAIVTVLLNQL
jgi:hypothetical protein